MFMARQAGGVVLFRGSCIARALRRLVGLYVLVLRRRTITCCGANKYSWDVGSRLRHLRCFLACHRLNG